MQSLLREVAGKSVGVEIRDETPSSTAVVAVVRRS
jgi:hypothetical protein